jgi:Flp pilus assembly protein TadG
MNSIKHLFECRRAAVLPLVAVVALGLLAAVAITIDISRAYTLQNKVQQASDAAILGAVATLATNRCDGNPLASEAQALVCETERLFVANAGVGYLNNNRTNVVAAETAPGSGIYQLTFDIAIPLEIMSKFGVPYTNFNILSQTRKGYTTVAGQRLELTLVLDTTASMQACPNVAGSTACPNPANAKIAGLKRASTNLINSLFGTRATFSNVWVSIVPYNMSVNVSNYGNSGWIQNDIRSNRYYFDSNLAGKTLAQYRDDSYDPNLSSINERTGSTDREAYLDPIKDTVGRSLILQNRYIKPQTSAYSYVYPPRNAVVIPGNSYTDVSDVAPNPVDSSTLFRLPQRLRITDGNPVRSYGYDDAAFIGHGIGLSPVLVRSQTKQELLDSINGLQTATATRIPVGLMWGWFTLSPNWSTAWNRGTIAPYNDPGVKKVIVLMTDGKNEKPDTNAARYLYDVGTDTTPGTDNYTLLQICSAIRAQGVDIYTVAFGAGASATADQNRLKTCSGADKFGLANTNEQLDTLFRSLADKIVFDTLRLTQ